MHFWRLFADISNGYVGYLTYKAIDFAEVMLSSLKLKRRMFSNEAYSRIAYL